MSAPTVRHLTQTLHHAVYPAISPTNPLNAFTNKTAIISGGATGIGYAIASGFAAAGASTVIITHRRQDALDEAAAKLSAENAAAGRTTAIWPIVLDLNAGPEAISAVFSGIRARLQAERGVPDADVLATSAVFAAQGATVLDAPAAEYAASFETNVLGNLNVVRAFLAPEAGAIPFVSMTGIKKDTEAAGPVVREKVVLDVSSASSYFPLPGQAAYAASKGAFSRIMRALAVELEQLPGVPIRVHSFNPGLVWSPMVAREFKEKGDYFPIPWDDESLPGGFAVWLTSPAARFLRGRFVLSMWDVHELMAQKEKFEEDPEFGVITLRF